MNHFDKVRFFLFVNSYSGKIITVYLRENYKKHKLQKVIKHLSLVLDFDYNRLKGFVVLNELPECPCRRVPSKLKVYLEIESELIKLKKEKLDEYSTAQEDYQRQLLSPAFERAAGNSLTNVKDDLKFVEKLEDNTKLYESTYYKVAYKYKLPTMRIVPFLLRLVRN